MKELSEYLNNQVQKIEEWFDASGNYSHEEDDWSMWRSKEKLLNQKHLEQNRLMQLASGRGIPQDIDELKYVVAEMIKRAGGVEKVKGKEMDLNSIDIRYIDDLSFLFKNSTFIPVIDAWNINRIKSFESMFEGNPYIVESPFVSMPSSLPGDGCCKNMFKNCVSLRIAPELPAEKLTKGCYESMFEGCKSLTQAPELPAGANYSSCKNMFKGTKVDKKGLSKDLF